MNIEGNIVRLRAVEPEDAGILYDWENDTEIWNVSGTTEPFSRRQMELFIERQRQSDLFSAGQLRLIVEARPKTPADTPKRTGVPHAGTDDGAGENAPAGGPVVSDKNTRAVGIVDLFEFDPLNRRAGIGILIYGPENRRRGYAADAVETLCRYARERIGMHQLWCNVCADNEASLGLFRGAGFTEAGVKRQWLWTAEGYRDEIMMQRILE